ADALYRDRDDDQPGENCPARPSDSLHGAGEEPENRRQRIGEKAGPVAGAGAPVGARVQQDLNHDRDSQAESEETVPRALIDPSSRREEDEERRKDEESLGGADEQARDAGERGMSIERMRAAEADGAVASPERVEKMHVVVEEGKQCRCRR